MALFDRFAAGLKQFGQGVKNTFGSAAKVFQPTSQAFPKTKQPDFDTGFSSGSTSMLAPKKAQPLEFKLGQGVTKPPPALPGPRISNVPPKLPAPVQKQIDYGRAEAAPKPLPLPQWSKNLARDIAPDTVATINAARNPNLGTVPRVGAAILSPLQAARELIVQPAARLGTQLVRNIAKGGADTGFTPQSTMAKFLLGRDRVKSLPEELGELPEVGYELAGQLPTVKMLPENSTSGQIARYGLALPLALVSGGLKSLDIDLGVGGAAEKAAKKGATELIEKGGERLAKEASERLLERGGRELTEVGERELGDFVPSLKKAIHPEDQARMAEFIDHARLKGPENPQLELDASRIAENYGIKMPKTKEGLANEFDKVLSEAKTEARKTIPPPTKQAADDILKTGKTAVKEETEKVGKGVVENLDSKIAELSSKLDELGGKISGKTALEEYFPMGRVGFMNGRAAAKKGAALEKTIDLSKEAVNLRKQLETLTNIKTNYDTFKKKADMIQTLLERGVDSQGNTFAPEEIKALQGMGEDYAKNISNIERKYGDLNKGLQETLEPVVGKQGAAKEVEALRLRSEGLPEEVVKPTKFEEPKLNLPEEEALPDIEVKTLEPDTINKFAAEITQQETINRKQLEKIIDNLETDDAEKQVIRKAVADLKGQAIPTGDILQRIEEGFGTKRAYGALAGFEPEYDEQGNIKGMKYNPIRGVIGIGATSAVDSKLGREALNRLSKARKEYIQRFLSETAEGAHMVSAFERAKEAFKEGGQHLENPEVVSAIKNTPYFRKEKDILDEMGRGVILEKGKRSYIEYDPERLRNAIQKGWIRGGSVDQMASEAGFERGEDYLKAVMDFNESKPPKDIEPLVHDYLLQNDPNYRDLSSTVEQAKAGAIRPEEVAFKGEAAPTAEEITKALEPGYKTAERGFVETVKESPKTAPEVARMVEGQYRVLNNKDMLESAKNLIANNRDEAIRLIRDEKQATPLANTVGQLLMQEYQAAGRYEEAVDIAEILAKKATTAGQAIQALSIWGRLTPEGALAYTQRLVNKAGNGIKLTEDAAKDIVEKATKNQELTRIIDNFRARLSTAEPGAGQLQLIDELKQEIKRLGMDDIVPTGKGAEQRQLFAELDKEIKRLGLNDVTPLSPKAEQQILSFMDRQLALSTAGLMDTMASQVPPTVLAKVSSLQTIAQLLNPKTIIRNLVGNLGFASLEQASDVLGSAVDAAVSLVTGKRSRVLPSLGAQFRGLREGWRMGLEDAIRGVDTSHVLSKHEGIISRAGVPVGRVWRSGPLAHVEKAMNVVLRGPDRAFYQAAYEGTLDNVLRASGYQTLEQAEKEAPEGFVRMAQEAAHAEGLRRTFQDDNVLSKVMSKIKKTLNADKDFGVGDLLIKYPKTPAAIVMRGLEYTPVGFVNAVWELAKPLIGGDVTSKTFNQKKFVDALSRATIGTGGLVGTGALLHKLGIIRGKEDDPDDVKAVKRQMGIQDYQINVSALKRFLMGGFNPQEAKAKQGDVLTSYDWFQPISIMLAMGADIDRAKGTDQGTVGGLLGLVERYGEGVLQGIDTLSEQPLFTGIRKFAQSRSLPDAIRTTFVGMPSSFVPTFLNQIKQLKDNVSRETYDPSAFKEAYNRTIYKIPGLSQTLPPRVTTFGKTQEMYQGGTNSLFNVFANPAFVNKIAETPEAKMVLDIYNTTGERRQVPNQVDRNQTAYGQKFKLTGQQISDMQRYMGTNTDKFFAKLAQNPKFAKLPQDKQIKLLGKVLTMVGAEAKTTAYFQHINVKPPSFLTVPKQAKLMQALYKKKQFKEATPEKQKQIVEMVFKRLEQKAGR